MTQRDTQNVKRNHYNQIKKNQIKFKFMFFEYIVLVFVTDDLKGFTISLKLILFP